jgi:hypothetical protein
VAVGDASDFAVGAILIRADLEKKFDDKCVSAFARANPTLLEEISWRFWGRISTIRACPPKAAFARGDISAAMEKKLDDVSVSDSKCTYKIVAKTISSELGCKFEGS